ncbi:MAG: M4 family metallopeptidase, partial [Bacteroidetes bacterium]|nr:M4 family metallopeptidase [Bacteroidota bacterium]
GDELPVSKINSWLHNIFGLDLRYTIRLIGIENDELGFKHFRYQQYFKETPLDFTMFILHTTDGMVHSMNGMLVKDVPNNSTPAVSEETALSIALTNVDATLWKWQAENTTIPAGELVYVPVDGDFANTVNLAWKFDIYAYEPLYKADVYVDAISGEIIFEHDMIHTVNVNGQAVTGYSGLVNVVTDSIGTNSFRLRETARGNGIETYDMKKGTSYGAAVDFTDSDNYWDNVNTDLDQYATDAHWGSQMTYDYFWNIHSRNSIDDNGFKLVSYVHYGNNYNNAFWNGVYMTYGDGSSGKPYQALDVCGHEITHGLTSNTSNLIYSRESGAMNESFSDIFGCTIEFYTKGSGGNWLMGEDLGNTFRNLLNPKAKNDPNCYMGQYWHTAATDNYGVHTNSGVQNHWFYILSEGKTGVNDNLDAYSVNGLGILAASEIAFRNNTVYLIPTSDYDDARFFSIQATIDFYGSCTAEVVETANAWYAVGVGVEFDSLVTANFTVAPISSCQAPLLTNFTNLSQNGEDYIWDFGDGSPLDSTVNPSHTYTTYGSFNVSLYADGGPCGLDTIIKAAVVKVDSTLPCFAFMPSTGAGQVRTTCKGYIFDDGGVFGNYGSNTNTTLTISPAGASSIMLIFIQFSMEPGNSGGCNFDYLEIFDGPTTASPSLGFYCNTLPPPDTLFSTTGDITIRQ